MFRRKGELILILENSPSLSCTFKRGYTFKKSVYLKNVSYGFEIWKGWAYFECEISVVNKIQGTRESFMKFLMRVKYVNYYWFCVILSYANKRIEGFSKLNIFNSICFRTTLMYRSWWTTHESADSWVSRLRQPQIPDLQWRARSRMSCVRKCRLYIQRFRWDVQVTYVNLVPLNYPHW